MEVIPAIDVRAGACVQLVGGDPATGTAYGDPLDAVDRWIDAGARSLHVVDLDAAMGAGHNREVIVDIVRSSSVPVQVSGGIRDVERGRALIDAGADRVVLGTAAITEPAVVADLADAVGAERVYVALEIADGALAVEGWTERIEGDFLERARAYDRTGIGGFLFTNVDIEGRLTGLDPAPIEALCGAVSADVLVAGGVASLADIGVAREAGADGVIVGTALYEGVFTLAQAMEAA